MDRLPEGVARVRASNASPMTLDGTNTYLVEGWVVDPGPADESHLRAVLEAAGGSIDGIALTHGHPDHADGAPELARLAGGAPVVLPGDGEEVGPLRSIATPGHSPDHVCLLYGRVCFAGDLVAGVGSIAIPPDEGSIAAYLSSLRRLRALDLETICPGHGPVVDDPVAKLDAYIAHRLDRERRVVEALDAGARSRDELLRRAWSEVDLGAPIILMAAHATLQSHLEKLRDEDRLPEGVEGI